MCKGLLVKLTNHYTSRGDRVLLVINDICDMFSVNLG